MNVPGTLAVASSWVELSVAPAVTGAGVAQVSTGAAWLTVSVTVAVAEE
jgi:hypothetical protein